MSGLVKAKKYDWKDSNMALFGSDTEKQVKKESAESEKAWQGCGQSPGLQIWRIVKFQVEHWPKDEYGNFFEGDSYIILNTYKEPDTDELKYDLHFWIGKYSTQDEYGTAAYKTVELDTYHDDKPVQHREVQGHESSLFKSYFPSMTMMKGGADTGFRRVTPEEYVPRLLKFSKKGKQMTMTEVPRKQSQLQSGDVFLLDTGNTLYVWQGSECNMMEKYAAPQEVQKIKSSRGGRGDMIVLDESECSTGHKFYDFLNDDEDDDDDDDEVPEGDPILMKVSDADGSIDMEQVKEGSVSMSDFNGDDVYVLDNKKEVFVWIGGGASIDERKNALSYAHNYLQNTTYPFLSISVLSAGRENKSFKNAVPGCA